MGKGGRRGWGVLMRSVQAWAAGDYSPLKEGRGGWGRGKARYSAVQIFQILLRFREGKVLPKSVKPCFSVCIFSSQFILGDVD